MDMQDTFALDVRKHIFQYGGEFARIPELAQRGLRLNMTYLALNLSHYVNGVAKKHGEVSRHMFADYPIDAITNGVHAATWTVGALSRRSSTATSPAGGEDNFSLRYALSIPRRRSGRRTQQAKHELLTYVNRETNAGMDVDVLTLGFARRAATYKRADLLFRDLERLRRSSAEAGPLQIVYAGKAHPQDDQAARS